MSSKPQIIIESDASVEVWGAGSEGWKAMFEAGKNETYKHSGAQSSNVCNIDLHKDFLTSQNNSFANGQWKLGIIF